MDVKCCNIDTYTFSLRDGSRLIDRGRDESDQLPNFVMFIIAEGLTGASIFLAVSFATFTA